MSQRKRERAEEEHRKKTAKQAAALVAKQDRGAFSPSEISVITWQGTEANEEARNVLNVFREKKSQEAALDGVKWFDRMETAPWEGIVRWTHRRTLSGGAGNLGQPDVKLLECIMILMRREEFIDLAMSHDYEDAILEHFTNMRNAVEGAHGEEPNIRICVGLFSINMGVSKWCRKHGTALSGFKNKEVMERIDSAITFIVYELGIEVIVRDDSARLGQYLLTLTAQLCHCIYVSNPGECNTLEKHPRQHYDAGEDFLRGESERERRRVWDLRQLWIAALQTIPGMSVGRAQHMVNVNGYSCPTKLLLAADKVRSERGDIEALASQLAHAFGGNTAQRALARRVIQSLTNADPNASLR